MKKLLLILMLAFGAVGAGPTATITVVGKTITDGHITVNRGETVCFDGTSSTDADGVTFTGITGDPAEAVVIVHDTGNADTSNLIALLDNTGSFTVTPNGGDLLLRWNASGIFK